MKTGKIRKIWRHENRWLVEVEGTPYYYEYWYDPEKRRTIRRSLRTKNIARAKEDMIDNEILDRL